MENPATPYIFGVLAFGFLVTGFLVVGECTWGFQHWPTWKCLGIAGVAVVLAVIFAVVGVVVYLAQGNKSLRP